MQCRSCSLLYQACKVILTLFVTQVDCERNFSKLRYHNTLHLIGNAAFESKRVYNFTNNKRDYKRFYNLPPSPMIFKLKYVKNRLRNQLSQWFSNCASRRPGASFQFSKGVVGYFGFVPLSLGFITPKEL